MAKYEIGTTVLYPTTKEVYVISEVKGRATIIDTDGNEVYLLHNLNKNEWAYMYTSIVDSQCERILRTNGMNMCISNRRQQSIGS